MNFNYNIEKEEPDMIELFSGRILIGNKYPLVGIHVNKDKLKKSGLTKEEYKNKIIEEYGK